MYKRIKFRDTVRIDPTLLSENVELSVKNALKSKLENRIDEKIGSIVAITKINEIGEGHILVGDGAVYYETEFEAICFTLQLQEIVEGSIAETVEFGAFVQLGPLDGLLHVSQITSEFMSYDRKNDRFSSKTENKSVSREDFVRARVVAISLNERDPMSSKIGLTMRQHALGRLKWLEDARMNERQGDVNE